MFSLKTKLVTYGTAASVVFGIASYKFLETDGALRDQKNEVLTKVLMQGLSSAHYSPERLDDNFSKKAFNLYLERLDYNKKFLLQSDVDQLAKYETQLDDEFKNGSFKFFDLSMSLFHKRLKEAESFYKEILDKPFEFDKEETIEVKPEKLKFATSPAALKEEWRKYLKYQALARVADALDTQQKSDSAGSKEPKKSMTEIEADARKKLRENYDDLFKRMSQLENEDYRSSYLNSFANVYDPHTEYYAPKEKEDFDYEFSGRLEGIGALLQEKDGLIKVSEITPGSPSYLQGELKPGDVILKVAQGNQAPVDIQGMRIDKAVSLIRGKKGTEVRLSVKKVDGTMKVISIIRDVVVREEGYAKSLLIKGGPKTLGYIHLPAFYADFKNAGGRNSGKDVAAEIQKLKQENAQGIILDLRNNGGGSLQDVVDMVGLFIKSGPVVQVKSANGPAAVLEDRDPQVQFGGPLVVLVNENSASASEIMAAAIQDYKRGVIVGSSTYGKGTVQQFFDLDQVLPASFDAVKPLGHLKLTTQKYYRISGKTVQLRGVTPDILLPDTYTYLKYGEKEQEYALPFDEIQSAKFNTWNSPNFSVEKLKAASKNRVSTSPTFSLINQSALRLKERTENTTRSLKLSTYLAEERRTQEESKKLENLRKNIPQLEVAGLKQDLSKLVGDTAASARFEAFTKNAKKDLYIQEAVAILKDGL
ncbi:carboxy terminal-processing peptidase [Rufibacter glacialis]|uniref:Carboxy terminal-processing peptidase n=1 Tax=Rufibacter glacialis TaxID=1259555 RepID=A0A5M8QLC5_9BACT|nr:carboxy terminal-processing peptidase [Rufibacter glacialis]KAA6435774.1 tail-specific protease [Rufibacter glacialis]GGK66404.1 tail-specific protease [Rufibacter glacialis]